MNLDEGMFLLDPAMTSDWNAAEAEINRIFERAGAEVVGIRNWDERKLAYQIGKFRRSLYVLTYFRAAPEKISGIERDVQLSEKALRVMILKCESMTDEDVQKSLAADPPKAARREDRERGEFGDRGDRGDRGGDRPRYRDRDRERSDRDRGEREPDERREPVSAGASDSDDE